MAAGALFNPFPGLRPFEPDEDHLFFGREKEIDDLLRRLRTSRFVAVVGSSGSGKSSLVRSGLIPSLHSGLMVKAGSSWRVSILRPGEDPIGNLAAALDEQEVLGASGELAATNRILLEATLRRGSLGLVNAVRQAGIPQDDNLLVVVDQFEELFRFRRSRSLANPRAEAVSFVKLLLEAAEQGSARIYVVLTMRSDFLGDCMEYPGLPEAVNSGQYLVPRMTRDELRSAITGPVAIGGGEIAPRAVSRLLNDVGDDPDLLPVLQHALMRTWDYWIAHRRDGEPIDVRHYEAIGSMREALSLHADEAFAELTSERAREIAEILFKSLTDTHSDSRGLRRPSSVGEIAAIAAAGEGEVIQVIETFRRPGRAFVMPPAVVPLESRSIADLSHESLMRVWKRLAGWTEEERASAAQYIRLARAAAWHEEGTAGLWRDPELELGLQWRERGRPSAAWARRYDPSYERAMRFLEQSETERSRLRALEEAQRKRRLRQAWGVAGVLGALLVVAAGSAVYAWRQQVQANTQRARADQNLGLAKKAVDEMLSSAGRKSARMAAELPEMEGFRRELLEKARDFYSGFSLQKPDSEEFRREIALAHTRLGDIYRLLQRPDDAGGEYNQAIEQLKTLARDFPLNPEYRQLLASTHNWLGESLRPLSDRQAQAERAYNDAIQLQEALCSEFPQNSTYRQELARSHYNRGILRADAGGLDDADYREAIRLLEPLARENHAAARQELARAFNNLGLLRRRLNRPEQARESLERAVAIHEDLARAEPGNRDYQLELAKFCDNLGIILQEQASRAPARERNLQAIGLLGELARPVPSVAIELAHARTLRGRLLEEESLRAEAGREYAQSVEILLELGKTAGVERLPEFRVKYGEALYSLAAWQWQGGDFRAAITLLKRAVEQHSGSPEHRINLAYDYLLLARIQSDAGLATDAGEAAAELARLLPGLPAGEREVLARHYEEWRTRVKGR